MFITDVKRLWRAESKIAEGRFGIWDPKVGIHFVMHSDTVEGPLLCSCYNIWQSLESSSKRAESY
jgi:hypothetical protein